MKVMRPKIMILRLSISHSTLFKFLDFIGWIFKRESSHYIACNDAKAFSLLQNKSNMYAMTRNWSNQNPKTAYTCSQKVCESLSYLFDNIYSRFGTKIYIQTFGIIISTNCVPPPFGFDINSFRTFIFSLQSLS